MADAKRTRKPGIAKKFRPQRDPKTGRFAPKEGRSAAEQFEYSFRESPHWLKRVRERIGILVMRAGFKISGLGLLFYGR